MNDLVSIIVPVYNSGSTLKETIDSVLTQTFTNWELILVNDGSIDNSLEVINNYNDTRIQVFTQNNQGVSVARNFGISKAKGNFVAFLDSDDLWSKDKLKKSIRAINSDNYAMVYSDIKIFYKHIDDSESYKYREPIEEKDDYLRLLIYDYIPTLTVIIRKTTLEHVGLFDINLNGTEDWDLWIRITKLNKIKYIPEPLSYYRYSEQGLSKDRDKHLIEEKKVLKKHVYENDSIPVHIKRKAKWVWLKKNFFNSIIKKNFFKALFNYLQMVYLMPTNFHNISIIWRRNG